MCNLRVFRMDSMKDIRVDVAGVQDGGCKGRLQRKGAEEGCRGVSRQDEGAEVGGQMRLSLPRLITGVLAEFFGKQNPDTLSADIDGTFGGKLPYGPGQRRAGYPKECSHLLLSQGIMEFVG